MTNDSPVAPYLFCSMQARATYQRKNKINCVYVRFPTFDIDINGFYHSNNQALHNNKQ